MKKIILFTLALSLFASSAFAAESKIAFFNMTEVAMNCNAFKDEQKKIQSAHSGEVKALEKQRADLQKKIDNFKKQAQALTAEKREDMNMELMRLSRDYDDKQNSLNRKISAAENKAREELSRVIIVAVLDYAKKNGYTAILDSNSAGAIYVDKNADVTKAILDESNRIWKEKPKVLTDKSTLDAGARLNRK